MSPRGVRRLAAQRVAGSRDGSDLPAGGTRGGSTDLDDESFVAATERLDAVLAGIDLATLTAPIRRRAMESFPVVVGTLDALHLATALVFDAAEGYGPLSVFAHERAMSLCARALGLRAPLLEE